MEEFKLMNESFDSMLMTQEMKDSILSIVSGCILLGNVELIEVEKSGIPDAAEIAPKCRATFNDVRLIAILQNQFTIFTDAPFGVMD